MSGEASFIATIDDWVTGNELWYRHTRGRRILLWLGLASGVLLVAGAARGILVQHRSFAQIVGDMLPVLFFSACVLLIPMTSRWPIRWHMRRQYAQRPSMGRPVQFRWSDERLFAAATDGTTDQPWNELHRQLRDDQSFVFLMTDQLMLLVPRRVLTDEQAADLVATADRYGPPIR